MAGRISWIHYRSTHELCLISHLRESYKETYNIYSYMMIFVQYGGLLSVRNRRVSILNSNLLWGLRRNLAVPG